jgi:hypothetical protein
VTPTLTYYVGDSTDGTNLGATSPSTVGTYTVVASFAGSPDYAAAVSPAVIFNISPIVNGNSANLSQLSATIVITGAGFDPTEANNTVAFSSGAGTVTAANSTQLTVTFSVSPNLGPLSAVVTTDGVSSGLPIGTPVEVATICSPTSITITAPPIRFPANAAVTVLVAADSGGPPIGTVTLSVDGGDDQTMALEGGTVICSMLRDFAPAITSCM